MRISSVQSGVYTQKQCMSTQNNPSHKGWRGCLKGGLAGGAAMTGVTLLALGTWPAALLLGGITAGLSAIIGNDVENQKKLDEKKKNNNQ